MTTRHTIFGMGLLAWAAALPALGQQGLGGGGPRHGDFDGPPPFEHRQGMRDADLKDALGVSDEQWKALQPKVARVQELQRDVAVGHGPAMGMGGGPGMPPPGFAMGAPGGQGGGGRHGGGPQGGRRGPTSRPAGGHGPTSRPSHAGGPPGGAFGAPDGEGHDFADHHGPRGGGPGGGFGPHTAGKPSKVMERFFDLQEALDDKDAKPEDLKAKVEAFHQARDEARSELTKAEAELRGTLTPMQEAALISMGVLD
jgi:hypothetical protein